MWKEIGILAFMVITGLNWAYYQVYSKNQITPTDVSLNIFIEVLGTGLTILVLDRIWHAEEKKRWREVKSEVDELLWTELNGIFNDMSLILIPPKAFKFKTHDELAKKTKQYQKDGLSELAKGDVKEVSRRITEGKHLFEGGYGDLFQKRYESLNNIEMKYSKFLEPSKLKLIIRLERNMKTLAQNIRTRLKLKEQEYGKFLVPSIESIIVDTVQEIVQMLDEAEKIGLYFLHV